MNPRKLTPELQREAACLLQRFFERSLDDEGGRRLQAIWKAFPLLKAEAIENYEIEHLLYFRDRVRKQPIGNRTVVDDLSGIPGLAEFAMLESTFDLKSPEARREEPTPSVPSRKPVPSPRPAAKPSFRLSTRWMSAAVCVLLLSVVYYMLRENGDGDFVADPHVPARIDGSAGALWDRGKTFLPKGTPLEPGWLRLTDGLAQLRLRDGASVIARGPTELVVDASGSVVCKSGRLSVDVPRQNRPLRIGLPMFTVVVKGTRFSVEASSAASEVHLLEGGVDIEYGPGRILSLRPGEAMLMTQAGEIRRLNADAATFTPVETMKTLVDEAERREAERTRRRRRAFRDDPSVLLLLDSESRDASWSHCPSVPGRLPDTKAIGFRDARSRLEIDVPAPLTSMTLAAWVRIDRLNRQTTILLGSQPYAPGSMSWRIEPSGTVKLLLPGGASNAPFQGAEIFKRLQWKAWTHVAVVVDGESRTITHYKDGKPVGMEQRQEIRPFRIGTALVGNGGLGVESDRERTAFLHGEIDELIIFNRALSPEELHELLP